MLYSEGRLNQGLAVELLQQLAAELDMDARIGMNEFGERMFGMFVNRFLME